MTESVAIEFEMFPGQTELALLPDTLDELFIDLRVQGDAIGLYTPEMEVRVSLGTSVTTLQSGAEQHSIRCRNRTTMGR